MSFLAEPTVKDLQTSFLHFSTIFEDMQLKFGLQDSLQGLEPIVTDDISNIDASKVNLNNVQTQTHLMKENQSEYVNQFLWYSPSFEEIYMTKAEQEDKSTQQQILIEKFNTISQQVVDVNKDKKSNQSQKIITKDYTKNLPGYIVKKMLRLIKSPKYHRYMKKYCQKWKITQQICQQFCSEAFSTISGPNSIYDLMMIHHEGERDIKLMFRQMMENFLRNRYTGQILKEGRMTNYQEYITMKNKYLLYFSTLLSQN